MTLPVVLTPRALDELAAAVGHLVDRNFEAALALRARVEGTLDLLASGVLEGSPARLWTGENVRRFVVSPLILYYQREADALVVYAIHDGRRAPAEE